MYNVMYFIISLYMHRCVGALYIHVCIYVCMYVFVGVLSSYRAIVLTDSPVE